VDRDVLAKPGSHRQLNEFNHNTAAVHSLGWTGFNAQKPVVIALMDSMFDSDMNGSGRPHRLFYVNGDLNNKTGGGLAGSRLLWNRAYGAQPADGSDSHGTEVAAVAAGAPWGSANAYKAHAHDAQIAGYAIADRPDSYSFYSTMISAWQAILADRGQGANLVVANNSYTGEQDPLHAQQQALDAAAYAGDILVVVAAANDGPNPSTGGQSCTNGLAVAAVEQDSLEVLSWSSRGPVVGDPLRTYPDISACTYARSPVLDCEAMQAIFSGTSCAAPQVAGIATVLRAGESTLQADETKAILLAATLDISRYNASLNENAFGQGFLRADWAAATTRQAKMHTRGALSSSSGAWTFDFSVQQGERYSVALAWQRSSTSTMNWSDLKLEILDGATIVARADSPRNLYEKLVFVAPAASSLRARVSASSLQPGLPTGGQEFGLAIVQLPRRAPSQGSVENYGLGCAGTGASNGNTCLALNPRAAERLTSAGAWHGYSDEVAVRLLSPGTGLQISGFELYLAGEVPSTIDTAIYGANNFGEPQSTPLATGKMAIDRAHGWYRTKFAAPVVIAPWSYFFVATSIHGRVRLEIAPDSSSAQVPARFFRGACNATWYSWNSNFHQGIRVQCGAPGNGAAPEIAIDEPQVLGASWNSRVRYASPNTVALSMIGFSDKALGALPLPLPLAGIGANGCQMLQSMNILTGTAIDAQGTGSIRFALPWAASSPLKKSHEPRAASSTPQRRRESSTNQPIRLRFSAPLGRRIHHSGLRGTSSTDC
jgi:hypothetical protein